MSRQRAWQIKRNNAGRCSICTEPLETATLCRLHAAKLRAYNRKRRERLSNAGLCVYCGKEPQMADRAMCDPCLAWNNFRAQMRKTSPHP